MLDAITEAITFKTGRLPRRVNLTVCVTSIEDLEKATPFVLPEWIGNLTFVVHNDFVTIYVDDQKRRKLTEWLSNTVGRARLEVRRLVAAPSRAGRTTRVRRPTAGGATSAPAPPKSTAKKSSPITPQQRQLDFKVCSDGTKGGARTR